jgi:hypothetical protein
MYSVLYFMQYNTLITKFLVVMTKEIENITKAIESEKIKILKNAVERSNRYDNSKRDAH